MNSTLLILLCIVIYCIYNSYQVIPTRSYKDFKIHEIPNFLTLEDCDYIIKYMQNDDINKYKFNSNMYWRNLDDNENTNQTFGRVNHKLKHFFNTIINKKYHIENLEIAHYDPNNTCQYHYDVCNGYVSYCNQFDKQHGPRKISIIMYLNDDYIDGGTHFRKINKNIKPEKGKLVWFENYNEQDNSVIDETEHCGDVVKGNKKYICVTWIRYPH